MANFTTPQDIKSMIRATEIALESGVKAYAFYQTNSASRWVVSGVTEDGHTADYYMIDTTFGTFDVANDTEFKNCVVN